MEQLLIKRIDAAKALGISVDKLDELRAGKKIQDIYIGSRVFISRDELMAFITKEGPLC